MRYLFVHQNFPGQFLHLLRHLLDQGAHEIVFVTEPNANEMAGVRKVTYTPAHRGNPQTHRDAQEFELALLRAEAVARVCASLRELGFSPDIVIGHEGWGEMLNLPDVWPDVPRIGYHEFYYHVHGVDVGFDPEFPADPASFPRVRAKNAVNLLALNNGGHGQSPTEWQRSTYPAWARPDITVVPEGVNLDVCRPDPAARARPFALGGFAVRPGERLVTYVSRDLEPYRGFHVMMRALPRLLRARPDLKAVLVGGDGVSYGARLAEGSWRARMLAEIGPAIDPARVHFPGKIDYASYVRLLQRSDAHVYLTYPFVASWSLREALACGCALVGSDTAPVLEFVRHRENGLVAPCLDPARVAGRVLELLEDAALSERVRHGARFYAETHLRMDDHIRAYEALIGRLVGGRDAAVGRAPLAGGRGGRDALGEGGVALPRPVPA